MFEQTDGAVTRESLLDSIRVLDAQNRDLRNEIETLRKVIDILHSSYDRYQTPYTSPAIPMPGTTPASPPWWLSPTVTCYETN